MNVTLKFVALAGASLMNNFAAAEPRHRHTDRPSSPRLPGRDQTERRSRLGASAAQAQDVLRAFMAQAQSSKRS
jgi:hypothetical protein